MTTAGLIKELRDITGAGMLDCKKAIEASNGNLTAAQDWLKAKGLSKAVNKASRTAAEGVAALKITDDTAVIIELNSETDFVAKNVKFQELVEQLLEAGLKSTDLESLKSIKHSDEGDTIEQTILNNIAIIGENLSLRRSKTIKINNSVIGYYVHNKVSNNMGRTAVLVELETDKKSDEIQLLANNIAMHIAAARPKSLSIEDLDKDYVEREKAIFKQQVEASGKPQDVAIKMAEGMLKKLYTDIVLLEQIYVLDPKHKINQILENASKEFGAKIKIKSFVKYEVGEGIEQKTTNFADEVASIIKN